MVGTNQPNWTVTAKQVNVFLRADVYLGRAPHTSGC
jgi:hypothetical protein